MRRAPRPRGTPVDEPSRRRFPPRGAGTEATVTDVDGPVTRGSAPAPISPGRSFDTWDVDHPTALVHLPSGLRVHVCAYSDRAGAFTPLPRRQGGAARTADARRSRRQSRGCARGDGARAAVRAHRNGCGTLALVGGAPGGSGGLRFWVVVAVEAGAYGTPGGGHPWRPVESVPGALGMRGAGRQRVRARRAAAAPDHVPFGAECVAAGVRGARVLVPRIAPCRGSGRRVALQPGGDARALPGHRRRGRRRCGACAGAGGARPGIRRRIRAPAFGLVGARGPPPRDARSGVRVRG